MTKPTKFGEMKVSIDNADQLKAGDGLMIGDTKYEYGANLEAPTAPLIDAAQGKTVAIRLFEFTMNPEMKGDADKQLIFNAHAKQIQTILWADGLKPLDEVSPRVILDITKRAYQIFVPCEARSSTAFIETPKTLSQQLR